MSSERISWKDSNLALIGSDLDHKIKQAAAEGEPQWQGIEEEGLHIWRIEQFRVEPWSQPGEFHTGDSYIVLNGYKKSDDTDALAYDIHIWIGKESSQDEYGTAAYKMVEADDFLSGAAIQHREVQNHESPLFQSYFEDGIKYLEGGVATGFNTVEPTKDNPHLYRVKGNEKNMSLTQVPLKMSSLNSNDSFILFANAESVWVWHGSDANPDEKNKAHHHAESLCTSGTVTTIDQGDDGEEFMEYLEKDVEDIATESEESDDDVQDFIPLLFKLPEADDVDGDAVEISKADEPVASRWGVPAKPTFDKSLLEDDNVYLVDAGWELFLWMGTQADRMEKLLGMQKAESYAKQNSRTSDLPMTMIKSGYETSTFNAYFV